MEPAAVQDVQKIQSDVLNVEFEGKLLDQFVDELKGSTLFQAGWSELIGAAPTALSSTKSLWIAATDSNAERISMVKSVPTGGFKHITNRAELTLRSCLVDVCNNGGRAALTKAGANMDSIQIISRRICDKPVSNFHGAPANGSLEKGNDQLEDLDGDLMSFHKDAELCASLATETRKAFTNWSFMVEELHACTEAESERTSIQKEATTTDEEKTKAQATLTSEATKEAEDQLKKAEEALKHAEKRLTTVIDKAPGPLEHLVTGAMSGSTSSTPCMVPAALPVVMFSIKPAAIIKGVKAAISCGHAAANVTPAQLGTAPVQLPAVLEDPSYEAAIAVRELVNHLYEYLGGDAGKFDKSRFVEAEVPGAHGVPQGVSYFLGALEGQKSMLKVSNTAANKTMRGVYDSLIKVTTEIQKHLRDLNNVAEVKLPADTLAGWKRSVKQAQQDVLQLSMAGNLASATCALNASANVKTPGAKNDNSAQNAQLNMIAMQAVQIAQSTVIAKQDAYNSAVASQAKSAAAMSEIQEKLKRLQDQGKILDEIKALLRTFTPVLVDLSAQMTRIEQLFTMFSTAIKTIIMVRADNFTAALAKAKRFVTANGRLKIDNVTKENIFTATLRLKAYFTLLQDITSMHDQAGKPLRKALDMFIELSNGTFNGNMTGEMQSRLMEYMNQSGAAVAKMVKEKQEEISANFRDRMNKAAEKTRRVKDAVRQKAFDIDEAAKQAIKAGVGVVIDGCVEAF